MVWRCHIGTDHPNAHTDEAWAFLRPHLAECHTYVFSRAQFVPSWLSEGDVHWIIPPSIDPLSPKNRALPRRRVHEAPRRRPGCCTTGAPGPPTAILGGAGPLRPGRPLVLQDAPLGPA